MWLWIKSPHFVPCTQTDLSLQLLQGTEKGNEGFASGKIIPGASSPCWLSALNASRLQRAVGQGGKETTREFGCKKPFSQIQAEKCNARPSLWKGARTAQLKCSHPWLLLLAPTFGCGKSTARVVPSRFAAQFACHRTGNSRAGGSWSAVMEDRPKTQVGMVY